ncbi:MAG TPA: helix-turn-helix transcriptional regulator [Alkalispirochaeta sp.]|nr:helix-turn-helix transcriptional regulator [Alkalispirochaeta sp.]
MKQAGIRLTQLAYRLEMSDFEWCSTVAGAAAELTPESTGAMVYTFDTSAGTGVQIPSWGSLGVTEEFVAATIELNRHTTVAEAEVFYRPGILCGTVSEQLTATGQPRPEGNTYDATVAGLGIPDSFGLTASDPDGRGIVVNAPLSASIRLDTRTRRLWSRLAVHLQAGFRLRRNLRQGRSRLEAVVDSEGRIVDAYGGAQDPDVREHLVQAARSIDRARSTRGPDNAGDALALWEGLVDGRWSLVEQFERDGRRYFLAYDNPRTLKDPRALTPREKQVVGHIGQGTSNKWTAYQLGISEGTVAKLLERALHKLGITTRHELVWIYTTLRRR